MQTILGSGGAIGIELAKALIEYTDKIRLVSRNPKKVNETDELFSCDLSDKSRLELAIEGSEVVYLTVGFKYNITVWRQKWPSLIKSVIRLCKKHQAKLVFFDNVYMYDENVIGHMTESSKVNPSSEKGKVRAEVARLILEAVERGDIQALIARSADFYGPGIKNTSLLTETVLNNLSKGKRANWMANVDHKHSFTYTPEAGKATALLGNTNDAYNQVWHLPTAKNPWTGKEWIENVAKLMNAKPKTMVISKFFLTVLGLFIPSMREMKEMMYQYDRDYVFDSSKFESRFNWKSTPYLEGLKDIIKTDYS